MFVRNVSFEGRRGLNLLTSLLTPWSRVLLEKLTGFQLVKKFPAFYGTRRFITALTNIGHLSLSWAISIQSIPLHPTSWRPILILSSHLRLGIPSGLFSHRFPYQNHMNIFPLPHTFCMPSPSHSRFYHPSSIGWEVQITVLLIMLFETARLRIGNVIVMLIVGNR